MEKEIMTTKKTTKDVLKYFKKKVEEDPELKAIYDMDNYIDEIVLDILKPFIYKKYGKIYIGHKETEGAVRYEGLAIQLKQKFQEVQQKKVDDLKEIIQNAKTVKSEMEEMEGQEFSDGYQKALEDILLTNK